MLEPIAENEGARKGCFSAIGSFFKWIISAVKGLFAKPKSSIENKTLDNRQSQTEDDEIPKLIEEQIRSAKKANNSKAASAKKANNSKDEAAKKYIADLKEYARRCKECKKLRHADPKKGSLGDEEANRQAHEGDTKNAETNRSVARDDLMCSMFYFNTRNDANTADSEEFKKLEKLLTDGDSGKREGAKKELKKLAAKMATTEQKKILGLEESEEAEGEADGNAGSNRYPVSSEFGLGEWEKGHGKPGPKPGEAYLEEIDNMKYGFEDEAVEKWTEDLEKSRKKACLGGTDGFEDEALEKLIEAYKKNGTGKDSFDDEELKKELREIELDKTKRLSADKRASRDKLIQNLKLSKEK
ncbi:MAG: hypothetical protein LBI61_00225 [Puniceicoccales bacterium]|jgi:hypothetical protein|nr:hypothetical protein [Puniceicoccales bacterium]